MFWAFIFAVTIGVSTIVQGGFNKQVTHYWDLTSAVLLNAIVYLVISLVLLYLSKKHPNLLPEIFRDKGTLSQFSWWFLIPGIAGLIIVAGMPWVIIKIGAFKMIVVVVATQLLVSMFWDLWVEKIPVNSMRIVGAVMAFAGAFLATFKS